MSRCISSKSASVLFHKAGSGQGPWLVLLSPSLHLAWLLAHSELKCLSNERMNRTTPSFSQREVSGFFSQPLLWLSCPRVLMDLEVHLSPVTGNWMPWPAKEKQVLNSAWYTEQTGITSVWQACQVPGHRYSTRKVSKTKQARWAIGIREENITTLFICIFISSHIDFYYCICFIRDITYW